MRSYIAVAVLSVALVIAATFAIWEAAGAPWQSQTSTPTPPPSHQWSEGEAVAVVRQALLAGRGGLPVSCRAVALEAASEWDVTCSWSTGTTCSFYVYEDSKAVTPVGASSFCAALLMPLRPSQQ